jgi:hypothetical protein
VRWSSIRRRPSCSLVMLCSLAATVGGGERDVAKYGGAVEAEVLPVTWLRTLSGSELGFVGGESGSGEPRTLSRRPPPLFIALGDGGPPAIDGLGAPDQGASQGPRRPLGFL